MFPVQMDSTYSGSVEIGAAHCFTPFQLPLWTEIEDLRRLLSAFEQALPLRRPSQLIQLPIVQFLIATSAGLLGEVSRMLSTAAELAIVDVSKHINLRPLERVVHAHALEGMAGPATPRSRRGLRWVDWLCGQALRHHCR